MSTPAMPSLIALRAFEATVRRGNMTRAADELCVTHGAISRHIKSLEDRLGVRLLLRQGANCTATAEGARLAEGLSAAFNLISATLETVRPGPLVLSCSASIMQCWLIPRMAHFQALHPDVQVELNMNYDRVDFSRDKVSLAIRNSATAPPREAIVREIGVEWIGPVCAPDYLATHPLATPDDLHRSTLLATQTRLDGWKDWAAAIARPDLALGWQRSFEHFHLLIQAAAFGLGVAMVPRMLVLNELHSGRLIAPFGFVPGARRLCLWVARPQDSRSDLRALESWLMTELASQG